MTLCPVAGSVWGLRVTRPSGKSRIIKTTTATATTTTTTTTTKGATTRARETTAAMAVMLGH